MAARLTVSARCRLPLLLATILVTAGCGHSPAPRVDVAATITVTSPAFAQGATIPKQFTCDGQQVSPPLAWSGRPAKAWALVVDDPDAPRGPFVHWVVLDIPAGTTSVGSGEVPTGGTQVANSSGEASYVGPCPPSGQHRYRFTVYGLDAPTGVEASASLSDAVAAISDHASSRGTMTAVYSRS